MWKIVAGCGFWLGLLLGADLHCERSSRCGGGDLVMGVVVSWRGWLLWFCFDAMWSRWWLCKLLLCDLGEKWDDGDLCLMLEVGLVICVCCGYWCLKLGLCNTGLLWVLMCHVWWLLWDEMLKAVDCGRKGKMGVTNKKIIYLFWREKRMINK